MNSYKAIIVDDDPTVLSLLPRMMQRRGYKGHTYDDPVKSPLYQCRGCPCSMHKEGCPDLIISDYNMPVVNGVELLESAKENGCLCRHLALITGAGLLETDLIRLAKYGTRHFTKPLDLDEFYGWLDRVEQQILNLHAA